MSTHLKLFLTAFAAISLIFVPGCEEEFSGYPMADDSSLYRMVQSVNEQSLPLGECGELQADATGEDSTEAAPCFWTKATVTIGPVTVVDWVFVCGNNVTVRIPNDPALIGLPITVVIPGVGTACGTVGE